MTTPSHLDTVSTAADRLAIGVPPMIGGGELGQHVREMDWSATPLGPYATWPQSLRSSLSLVLNAKGIAALYWGAEQWLLYNDAYGLALGDRHPWAFGRPMSEVLTDIAPVLGPQVAEVMRTGKGFAIENLSMVMHRHGRDEETTWTYSFSPVQGEIGGFSGVLLLATEMTAQKIVEAKLSDDNRDLHFRIKESTRDLDRIWSSTNDLMGTAGFDGFLKVVNPAWERALGWDQETLLTRSYFDLIHPDDHAITSAALGTLLQGVTVKDFVDRLCTKDGDFKTIMWDVVPLDGMFYMVGRDITGQRETEEALRQSQKMEAVGQLTGGVAHDFNNLLTVIKSSTDLLKRPNLSEERRARYVAAISDTVDRAAKLTGQLLAFARRQALKPEVFAACGSVRALSDMVGTLTGSRIAVTIDLPDELSYVEVDPSQFDTALVNLAVNARDAMAGEGRITIAVRTVDAIPAIRSHPDREGAYVAVSLTDTGSGMSADIVQRIFTTKEVGKGTGLGLSQVFGFAKQSGGDITVDSTVGEGTTFTLYLPQVAAPASAVTVVAPEVLVDGHGTRVLVVEDNADVGTFAVQTLADLGYTPMLATDGPAALAALAKDPTRFDVVFSDIMMPGMSGVELGQEIRRLYHDLPVVLTSGYSHVLAQNGTHGFELLQKPYSIEQLSQILRKAATWQRRQRLLVK